MAGRTTGGDVATASPTVDGHREPWAWFGPLMLAMGLAFAVFTLAGWSGSTALAERGISTTATVVAKYTMPSEGGREYRVKYEFATPDGQRHTGDEIASQSRFDALELGDPLAVVYLPEDPANNTFAPYGAPSPIVMLAVLAFEALFIAIGARYTLRQFTAWTERRL